MALSYIKQYHIYLQHQPLKYLTYFHNYNIPESKTPSASPSHLTPIASIPKTHRHQNTTKQLPNSGYSHHGDSQNQNSYIQRVFHHWRRDLDHEFRSRRAKTSYQLEAGAVSLATAGPWVINTETSAEGARDEKRHKGMSGSRRRV